MKKIFLITMVMMVSMVMSAQTEYVNTDTTKVYELDATSVVSFFQDGQIIISDLFVIKEKRRKGLATKLLNEIESIVGKREISIVPSNDWQKEWYIKRGYKIVK